MMKKLTAILLLLLLLAGCALQPQEGTLPGEDMTQATEATEQTKPAETTAPTVPAREEKTPPSLSTGEIARGSETLKVHFIDVGQADCALLECGNSYALIDAGYAESGDDVVEYLTDLGVQRLNLVVGTHPHGDHIGGLPTVMKKIQTDNVWFSAIPYTNSTVNDFVYAANKYSTGVQQPGIGQTFQLGGATITVLGPVHSNYEDVNDISLVLMVQFGEIRFLFTGDMEQIAENDLMNSGADVKADVLKVGHHGSYSSTGYVFLREVDPEFAVICCGRNNEYGHPHRDPMSRLQDAEVTIFRTDKMYTIVATTDGTSLNFTWGNAYATPWTPDKG